MIGLVMATEMEAAPLLARLQGVLVADAPFPTYDLTAMPEGPVRTAVISGMGKKRAAEATEYLITQRGAKVVMNLGICGSLKAGPAVGEVIWARSALDGDAILSGAGVEEVACHCKALSAEGWTLATVDEPVFQDDRRAALAGRADLVDMEGFAVAQTCHRLGVPCELVKAVSDQADIAGKEDIRKNITAVSEVLADAVVGAFLLAARVASPGAAKQSSDGPPQTAGPDVAAGQRAAPTSPVKNVLRLTKIEHTLFSLPLLFAGAWLGAGRRFPAWSVLAWIVLAGAGARTLGMAMNRFLDRRLDEKNPRTSGRELPAGRMSPASVLAVAAAALAAYLLACWGLGPICLMLSPVPAIPLIGYSLLKRFTSLCHFGIGLCMAMAPLAAFVAASNNVHFDAPSLLLAAFAFCWISGFDIIYAIMDIASDRRTGVRSIPAALGAPGAELVSLAVHAVAVAALVGMWRLLGGGACSTAAMAVAVGAFVAGHWPTIPPAVRFFPISAIASVAGAMVCLLGGLP